MKRHLKRLIENSLYRIVPLGWRMTRSPRLLVLMYHRVLPENHPERAIEQPGMYVSPETLDMHLEILKRYFSIVHLDEWVRGAYDPRSLPRLACALTFDDGWRDNFDYAFPVLRRHAAPAMIFLVSMLTGTDKEFWPNRLGRLLMAMTPNAQLSGRLGDVLAPVFRSARSRGAWSRDDLDRAIELAKQLDETEIEDMLDYVQRGLGTSTATRALLNEDEVRTMAASGLVRFGSHTRTHYRFRGKTPADVLMQEIEASGADIARTAGRPARVFCYPNGDTTVEAVDFVRQHYTAAVTTRRGWHVPGANHFLINRIGVHEDISNRPAAFVARISGWL